MKKTNPKLDPFFKDAARWRKEMETLREIILSLDVTEELKWNQPFYTHGGGNVLVIWGFKDACALGFCKGALLKDTRGLLTKAGENAQALRRIMFTRLEDIKALKPALQDYIREAIELEKTGAKVTYKKTSDFAVPEELQKKLRQDAALKKAFAALTPGRQRGYLIYFSSAKQAATRVTRIDKCRKQILAGKGWNEPLAKA